MHQALEARLPPIRLRLTRTEKAPLTFLDPSPTFTVDIESLAGEHVGIARYGVNPLNDRLYVFWIEVVRTAHRQGYGLAILWALHQQYRLPIVPNHIWGSALGFWAKARERFRTIGVTIDPDLRCSEMEKEKARWAHLVPEPEHLRLIREYREYEASQRLANISEEIRECIFLSRREAEEFILGPNSHLISISDGPEDQANIDEARWKSVSYHHFIDAGFDEEVIKIYGSDFERHYIDCLLADKAESLRQRIAQITSQGDFIAVNCHAGRSRSAAVALYITKHHGYWLNKPTPDANQYVYRMLAKDPSLLRVYEAATGHL